MNFSDNNECFKGETDLFSPPIYQTSVVEGAWHKIEPAAGFETGNLVFEIPKSEDYIDLNDTEIYIKGSLKDNGKDITVKSLSETDVSVVNNFLGSLFSQVKMSLNNVEVENSNGSYAYRSYLENLLSFGTSAKETHQILNMFYKDDAKRFETYIMNNEMDSNTPPGIKTYRNSGYFLRQERLLDSPIEMIGRLHCDLCNSNRYLINNVPVKIEMERSGNKFILLSNANVDKISFTIEKCYLLVRKVKLSPSIMAKHIQMISKQNAIYPIRRVVVKNNLIHKDLLESSLTGVYTGKMPRRIVFGLVKHDATVGDTKLNPFYFQHYNLKKIELEVGGYAIPYKKGITMDYDKKDYMQGYNTLFKGLNRNIYETGHDITWDEYLDGYCLYAFNLTPDQCDGEHWSIPPTGSLNINLEFSKKTPDNISAVVYLEFDGLIEINQYRGISFDYKV